MGASHRVRVTLLATGGTIACRRNDRGHLVPGVTPEQLIADIPDVARIADATAETMRNMSGFDMGPPQMVGVAQRCRELLELGEADAVVVTHGTDTIEETMYVTEMLAGDATVHGPIVFTGAMRAGCELGADGPSNLFSAFRVAASSSARGRGVLLCFNDQIHCASWVTKLNTTNVATFEAVAGGPVGSIRDGEPVFVVDTPTTPRGSDITGEVPLVKAYTGMTPDIFEWLLRRGIDGLVIEGTGAGNLARTATSGVRALLDANVPVVVTSRCPYGVPASPYGGPGGGATLDHLGVLRAAHLNGPKARLALMVGLHETSGIDELREWFAAIG